MIRRTTGGTFSDIILFQQVAFTLELEELQRVIISYLQKTPAWFASLHYEGAKKKKKIINFSSFSVENFQKALQWAGSPVFQKATAVS